MTNDELKQTILCLIEQLYNKKYIGKLWIKNLTPIGYQIKFGINNDDKPLVISAELPEDEFIKFMKNELRERRLDYVKYFIGVKTYPDCYVVK